VKGVTPNKENQRRFEIIVELGCIICKRNGVYTPPQIHHIDGCKNQEKHAKTIGLCYFHHMADQQNPPNPAYTSRHPNKAAFERRYGTEETLLKYQNHNIARHSKLTGMTYKEEKTEYSRDIFA
jgi:hypothetical protein